MDLFLLCETKKTKVWTIEAIKERIGPLSAGLYEVSEIVELLLSEAPRFVRSGVLTAEFLVSAFGRERLPSLGIFLSAERLSVSDLPGRYLVAGGEVTQINPLAHGVFLGDTAVTILAGEGSFFGQSTGEVKGTGRGFAYESSMVDALDRSFVSYTDKTSGLVRDRAEAVGGGFASLQVSQEGSLRVSDEAFFLARHKAVIEASGRAYGMGFDESIIVPRGDTFVVPMDESVAVEASESCRVAPLIKDESSWNALRCLGASYPYRGDRRREMERICHMNV